MPKKITVIGAGIVGVATASYLKRDGHDVTLVDMREPGEYCSFGNAGILSPGSCAPLGTPGVMWKVPGYLADPMGPLVIRWTYLLKAAPWLLRFVAASAPERVEKIADALRPLLKQTFDAYEPLVKHAGVEDLIRRTGYVVAYAKRSAYLGDTISWKLRRDRGVIVEELDRSRLHDLVPQLSGDYEVGLYLPEQGFVANPSRLAKALAAQFQRDGGAFLQREVRDIDVGPDGPRALVTNDGPVPVETLVICAGSHSNEFTSKLGDRVPLEAERGYHVTFEDPGVELPMPIFMPEHKIFVTPMEVGLRVAGQSEFAGIHAPADYSRAEILGKLAQKVFPTIRTAGMTKWMGRRPSMPDSLPVIGRATKFGKVYYAFGHGHVGLCSGAPTGRIIADLVAGRQPSVDVRPYRPDRF